MYFFSSPRQVASARTIRTLPLCGFSVRTQKYATGIVSSVAAEAADGKTTANAAPHARTGSRYLLTVADPIRGFG
jgi:hypothetical protein